MNNEQREESEVGFRCRREFHTLFDSAHVNFGVADGRSQMLRRATATDVRHVYGPP